MVMSQSNALSSIFIGIIELVLGTVAVICGLVSMSKLTSPAAATIGIWALFFAIPGVLCIVAGYQKQISVMGVSLGMNIVGAILAFLIIGIGGFFWQILNGHCIDNVFITNKCDCDLDSYSASCSDLKVVRNATGVATIVFVLLLITSIVGSIFGCLGTCCAPRESQAVVALVPSHPSTIVMNTTQQSTSYGQPSYPAPTQQGFVQATPPPYDNQYNHGFQYQQNN